MENFGMEKIGKSEKVNLNLIKHIGFQKIERNIQRDVNVNTKLELKVGISYVFGVKTLRKIYYLVSHKLNLK